MKKFLVLAIALFSLQGFANSEINDLMRKHDGIVYEMSQLINNELPQKHSIEQMLFQRHQHINRMFYIRNVLAGPLYPYQRQAAMMEAQQLQMGLMNGDAVLNQFINNYNFMFNRFWQLSREAQILRSTIHMKQSVNASVVTLPSYVEPTPQRLADLEAEKTKLEKGKAKLLSLAREAEAVAQQGKALQDESRGLVDELSETLNWNN